MIVADYVVSELVRAGVREVFLLPGGGSMYLVDALARCPSIRTIAMLHEQGATIAAEAYAQAQDRLGVVFVTTGPGGTNAMTGVASAWLDSVPLVVVSGQVKTSDLVKHSGLRQRGFQEVNVVEMSRPITKFSATALSPESAVECIDRALKVATEGRPGPVWIDIPLDVQSAEIQHQTGNKRLADSPAGNTFNYSQLVQELRSAKRPLVLLGNGIRLADATTEVSCLVQALQVPYQVTWKALDFIPFDHPLFAGRPGGIATRYANFAQQTSDLFIAIGARMDYGQTAYNPGGIAPKAKRYFIDIDSHELNKLKIGDAEVIHVDAREFLQNLLEAIGTTFLRAPEAWISRVSDWKTRYSLEREIIKQQDLGTYDVIEALSRHMNPEDVLVPGSSGACSEVTMQAFKNKTGQRVLNSQGLGAMGFGVPAAIGAAVAYREERDIYSVDGDGGFVMNIQELEVAKRLNLPICWIVLDNDGYGSIVATQNNYFAGRKLASDRESGLTLPPLAQLAMSWGLRSKTATTKSELEEFLGDFRRLRSPSVVVVRVSKNHQTIPRVASSRQNGVIVSDAMEDMTPKIPREILNSELAFD